MQEQELPLVRWTSGSFSLLVRRKEPKKHAPEHCALWASCPKGARQRPGSADCTSCATAECARSLARTPAGPDRPLPPQGHGAPGRARARASCAQKPEQSSFALAVALDPGPRQPRQGQAGNARRVARRDAREFANGQDAHRANPGLTLRTRSVAASAAPGVCSLWLLSLAQARESDPRVGRARKTAGCANKRIKGKNWIPAYAGMASKRKGAGFRLAPE